MVARYGNSRVKKGLLHFFIGKSVSAVGGMLAMVLIVRALSVEDFAHYSVLVALVEVFVGVAGLGVSHVVLRYVPELYAGYRTGPLRQIILTTLGLRTAVLLVALAIVWLLSAPVGALIGLDDALQTFQVFLIVVAFRSTNQFLSQILESTLHQGIAQSAFSLIAIGRCLGMLWMSGHTPGVELIDVIWLELACEVGAVALMLTGIYHALWVAAPRETQSDHWLPENRHQIVRFALAAWLQHLATLPFGGNTNRLVGGSLFSDLVMASFGFALSLYEYAKRYLPTQLLIGVIRPIVVARYTTTRNFPLAAGLCEKSLQINMVILAAAIAVLLVCGDELLGLVSAGKYVENSVGILCVMLVLLAFETQRLVLEVLVQMVEHYEILIPSNIFLSLSVFGGFAGYNTIGAMAFPLANLLVLIIANAWTSRQLGQLGYPYVHNWRAAGWSVAVMAMASGGGRLVLNQSGSWVIALSATLSVLALLFFATQLRPTIRLVRELVGNPETESSH